MIVARFKRADLREVEAAEIRFQPGIDLIVGVNGAGGWQTREVPR